MRIVVIMKIISVDGIIGAGKTTLLQKIRRAKSKLNIVCVEEPVSDWESICCKFTNPQKKVNALHLFYEDASKWAFGFEVKYIFVYLYQLFFV